MARHMNPLLKNSPKNRFPAEAFPEFEPFPVMLMAMGSNRIYLLTTTESFIV
jgi:hypothetical protein